MSQNKTLYLENLKATPFVALYTDETGNTRVSGSPDYPLTFSFEIGGGLYNCTLSGTVRALMRSCRFLSVLLYLLYRRFLCRKKENVDKIQEIFTAPWAIADNDYYRLLSLLVPCVAAGTWMRSKNGSTIIK